VKNLAGLDWIQSRRSRGTGVIEIVLSRNSASPAPLTCAAYMLRKCLADRSQLWEINVDYHHSRFMIFECDYNETVTFIMC